MQVNDRFFWPALLAISAAAVSPIWADELPIERGREMFAEKCAACHGENAKGGRGSDLTTGQWRWGGSDTELKLNIRQGIPGTQMPPTAMSEEAALDIIAFLRTLSREEQEPVKGDPAKGREIFFGAGGCTSCHFFGGHGGRLGPDLTNIRDEKKLSELRKAVTDPSESLRPGFETIEVEFPDGRIVGGEPAQRGYILGSVHGSARTPAHAVEKGCGAREAYGAISDAEACAECVAGGRCKRLPAQDPAERQAPRTRRSGNRRRI